MVRARRLCCSVHTVGKTKDSSCIFNPPGLRLFLLLFLLFLSRPKCQGLSYQRFLVRPLLREPRPQVHYKSQPDATAQRETQKSTNVKSLTKIDRISHGADVVGQSVPGGRTRM